MIKKWLIVPLSLLLALPLALADIVDTLGRVWWKIISFGNLTFLGLSDGSVVVAFTRLLIWLFVFTVMFAVITAFGGKGENKGVLSFLNRNQALVIALVVATIAAIYLPAQVLLATGVGWATAIALLLIGGPIVGLGYLLITYPEKDKETKGTVLLKLLICMALFWILSAMKFHVSRLA